VWRSLAGGLNNIGIGSVVSWRRRRVRNAEILDRVAGLDISKGIYCLRDVSEKGHE
jgi:hypothetical protein